MTRRIVVIVVAIVLATLGAGLVISYAVTADMRARSNIEGVTVAIADKRIPAGTSGAKIRSEKMFRLERFPKTSVPSDALNDVSAELDRLVVTSTVAPGQVLLSAMFGEQSKVNSGLNLPDGKMAVTVSTGVPEQVAGYVQPGARVAVFVTYTLIDKDGRETKFQRTRVLLPDAEVLTVGAFQPTASSGGAAATVTNAGRTNNTLLVTLAVNQDEAERLIEALNTGKLYLGLLTDAINVKPGPGVENVDGKAADPLFP
jgi:pilus assembly protein CpaB